MTNIDVGIYQGIEEINVIGKHTNVLHVLVVQDTDPWSAYIYTRGCGDNYKRDRTNIHAIGKDNLTIKKILIMIKENKKSKKWANTFLSNPAKYINQLPLKPYRNEDERS